MTTSVTVHFQCLSTDKLNSEITFEYVAVALTILQMFATMGGYPASSGIAISLFALVSLGVNRFVQFLGPLATCHLSYHHGLQAAILEVVFYPFCISYNVRSCSHFCSLLGTKRARRWLGFLASFGSVRSFLKITQPY